MSTSFLNANVILVYILFNFKLFILYWAIADQQCCDSFRWTTKELSHMHSFSPTLPSYQGYHIVLNRIPWAIAISIFYSICLYVLNVYLLKSRIDIAYHVLHQVKQKVLKLCPVGLCLILVGIYFRYFRIFSLSLCAMWWKWHLLLSLLLMELDVRAIFLFLPS